MTVYEQYATFYDGSGQIRFAILMHQYLQEVLARHPVPGHKALDLACGTGTLALTLAQDGWELWGLDQSAAMLAIARERASTQLSGIMPVFERADLRQLDLLTIQVPWYAAFDLVTCTYDSLNYLLRPEELAACLRGAAQALRPGGLFFGDMNTRHFLEHEWGSYEVIERPGFVQVSQTSFDVERTCSSMKLTGFVGDDERGFVRFDELHVERAYAATDVAALIEQVGLELEAVYECFTFQAVHAQTQRIAWLARRPHIHPS